MENKFRNEVDKIELLLNKVEQELNTQALEVEFTAFFKNVDKSVEIYNLCLEELCGQLQLLELPGHSRAFHKLCFSYKHQLYNVIKLQLSLQKEIVMRAEVEKDQNEQISQLNNNLHAAHDKMGWLERTIEEQKARIERLMKKQPIGTRNEIISSRRGLNLESEATFSPTTFNKGRSRIEFDRQDLLRNSNKVDLVQEVSPNSDEKNTLLPVKLLEHLYQK